MYIISDGNAEAQSEKELDRMKRSEYLVSIMRHDMRHFLNDISALIQNGEYDRAQTYIHEIIENVDATVENKYCGNKIVNRILSSYENMIREHDIDFQYMIKLPEELKYSDSDISAILSNALENAVHAVLNLKQGSRRIVLDMHMNNGRLRISLKNTYDGRLRFVDEMPQTQDRGLSGQAFYKCRNIFGMRKEKYGNLDNKRNGNFPVYDTCAGTALCPLRRHTWQEGDSSGSSCKCTDKSLGSFYHLYELYLWICEYDCPDGCSGDGSGSNGSVALSKKQQEGYSSLAVLVWDKCIFIYGW